MAKTKRKKIDLKIQLHLWVAAGGRCEFPGCNKPLWRDDLTFTEGNYSNISHIIAQAPNGPRGNTILSKKLEKNFDNLMLMCQAHNKLIDSHPDKYTADFLRKAKKIHEEKIKTQTGIQSDKKTTVIRLQANIRSRKVEVAPSEVNVAVVDAGRYPDGKGVLIDLTQLDYARKKSLWDTAVTQIKKEVDRALAPGNDGYKLQHISVFGLAPIPLLVYLGFALGNTIPADIYIKLRNQWIFKKSQNPVRFPVYRRNAKRIGNEIGLSIAITGTTPISEMEKYVGKNSPIYEVKITKPGVDMIKSASDLENFRLTYRKLIDEIRQQHGKQSTIHLFGAMPTCAAIVCGRELLHGVDPTLIIYEHADQKKGFVPAVKVN